MISVFHNVKLVHLNVPSVPLQINVNIVMPISISIMNNVFQFALMVSGLILVTLFVIHVMELVLLVVVQLKLIAYLVLLLKFYIIIIV